MQAPAPPPPPPPRLPLAAFETAITAQSLHIPHSHQTPTLHLVVILGPSPVPLLRHAHHLQFSLAAHGLHVFLHTEIDSPLHPILVPISPLSIPSLAAQSSAHFFALLTDIQLKSASIKIRLAPDEDLSDVPISRLSQTIFTAWARHLRLEHPAPIPAPLDPAANPNFLTEAHLNLLLRPLCPSIPHIPHAYASLLRLARLTHDWQPLSPSPSTLPPHPFISQPLPDPCAKPEDQKPQLTSPLSPEISPHDRTLCESALRLGLREIQVNLYPTSSPPPKPPLSFHWLRRSNQLAAHLLRAQLLARHLHQSLLTTRNLISTTSQQAQPPSTLPSPAHRNRLLREVNDLLPRVEELGKRLSKRPRAPSPSGPGANPWAAYHPASSQSDTDGWKCCACGSLNRCPDTPCLRCKAPCCRLDRNKFPCDPDRLTNRFRDAIANGPVPPTPWLFAPAVFPIQPLANGPPPYLNGPPTPPRERERILQNAGAEGEARSVVPPSVRNGGHLTPKPGFDLAGQFRQIVVDDGSDAVPINGRHRRCDTGELEMHRHQGSSQGMSSTPPQASPVRLATSAPSGTSFLEFDFARRPPPNGRFHEAAGDNRAVPAAQHSLLQPNSDMTEQGYRGASSSAVFAGSLPESEAYVADMSYGVGRATDGAGTQDYYATSRPHKVPPQKQDGFKARRTPPSSSPLEKRHFRTTAMEELAMGSYEAATVDDTQRFSNTVRRVNPAPVTAPGALPIGEPTRNDINSLEALAAASDAANGGTGSATTESLRAVSAVVSAGRGHSAQKPNTPRNGMYNMF